MCAPFLKIVVMNQSKPLKINSNRKHITIVSRPRRQADEQVVQNGLALTPAQMDDMVKHNIPIAPQNLGLSYDDGVSSLNFETPPEYVRGVDIGELWELGQGTNRRFKDALKSGIEQGIVTPVKTE